MYSIDNQLIIDTVAEDNKTDQRPEYIENVGRNIYEDFILTLLSDSTIHLRPYIFIHSLPWPPLGGGKDENNIKTERQWLLHKLFRFFLNFIYHATFERVAYSFSTPISLLYKPANVSILFCPSQYLYIATRMKHISKTFITGVKTQCNTSPVPLHRIQN